MMSTPSQYYNSLPPVAKTYVVACILVSAANYLDLCSPINLYLSYGDVIKRFQVWRLISNFFFLGPYSLTFGFRIITILLYGVSLERGPFDKRTADYLWMFIFGSCSLLAMAAIPYIWSPFLGGSLVFMIVYVWAREFPNERVNIHGLFELKGFYLPWYVLGVDLIFGIPLKQDLLGMAAGHLYYFLTVIYPLSGGRNFCTTPYWVHKLVAIWGKGYQRNSPIRIDDSYSFRGRSQSLNGSSRRSTSSSTESQTNTQSPGTNGGVFQGRSHRLNAN